MATAAELEARNKELEAELEKAKIEAEQYKPFRSVEDRMFKGVGDVKRRFSKQQLKDIAGAELASMNSERLRRGFLPIDWSDEEWEAETTRAAEELVGDRRRHIPTEGPLARTLKMVAPTKDRCKVQPCYEHGHLVQVRVEAQINNQAGSLGDGITRYKDKGYKLAVNDEGAMICAAQECNEWAAMENGKYTHRGYCTETHMKRVEGNQGEALTNAITRDTLGGRFG